MNLFITRSAPVLLALLVVTLVCFGEALSADFSPLALGKTRSGTISNQKKAFKGGLPTTQEVTLRVESVSGDKAKIFLSWGKTSRDTGDPGSGTFDAQVSEEGGLPKLVCETGKMKWVFIFQKDGTASCYLGIPDKMVSRGGDLQ